MSVLPVNDIEITSEFEDALALMENTRKNLFVTGNAGTGKSTLLRHFRQSTLKNVVILAPTGIAAVNVGGQTIHSFFQLPPRLIQPNDIRRISRQRKLFERLDTLIIDEVSMVRADLMDAIDVSLRLNRESPTRAFGGVQVIAFGDLHQLSPVVNTEMGKQFGERYKSPYFFDADIVQQGAFQTMELTKVFRQQDQDFIELLNKVRTNVCEDADLERLNDRIIDSGMANEFEGVILTTTNAGADRINRQKLAALDRPSFKFKAEVEGKFDAKVFPNAETLELKVGAQVMLIKNDPARRWVNGDIAVVESICDDSIFVTINGRMREVKPVQWDRVVYALNKENDMIEPKTVGTFEQYPLKLAWAMTIHKSQGQTFDEVLIDMERGSFAHGQLYVALSRCRTLSGISLLRPLKLRDVIFDEQVNRFTQPVELEK